MEWGVAGGEVGGDEGEKEGWTGVVGGGREEDEVYR